MPGSRGPFARLLEDPIARALLALLLLPGLAGAHIGAGAGDIDVTVPAGGAPSLVLEAPWGLVVTDDRDDFRWICHEQLSSSGVDELPAFAIAPDGALLGVAGLLTGTLVTDESLYRSTNGGCDWEAVQGTTGRTVEDAAWHPTDATVALGVTSDRPTDGGAYANGVLRTTDGGATWVEVAGWSGVVLRSVEFGPGGIAYALGVREDPVEAVLFRSGDGGDTWVERPLPELGLESVLFGVIEAVDPVDADEVWMSFDGSFVDGLVRTTDGGDTFEALDVVDLVLDVTLHTDGSVWLVGGPREVWYSPDRASFEKLEEAPQVWGGAEDGDRMTFAVNTLAHPEAMVSTVDGVDYDLVLDVLELDGPIACPAESLSAQVCEPLWEDLQRTLELMRPRPSNPGDDDDSAAPTDDCEGCSASGADPGGAAALLLLFLLLRRGTVQPQSTFGSPSTGATRR